jgi:type II secretory pathway component GspD/PulD (secretin)
MEVMLRYSFQVLLMLLVVFFAHPLRGDDTRLPATEPPLSETTVPIEAQTAEAPPDAVTSETAPPAEGGALIENGDSADAGPPVESTPPPENNAPAESQAPAADPPPANPPPLSFPPREADPDASIRFAFREAPWVEVLRQFADWTGLMLDLTDTPPGTFSYYDQRRHSPAEAVDVLNGYLLPRGYVLLRRDRFLAVLKTDNPALKNLIPTIELEELSQRGDNELLRVVFPLDKMSAEKAEAEVGKLLGPLGEVAALEGLQSVVVQGFGRNLREAASLLDLAVPPATDDRLEFRAFPLAHLSASEAEKQIRSLFGLGSGTLNVSGARTDVERALRYRSGDSRRDRDSDDRSRENTFSAAPLLAQAAMNMQVSALPRTNSLLVTATPAGLQLVEKIITSIDHPAGEQANAIAEEGARVLRVYTVDSASEEEVAKTIDAIMPGVVVNEDRRQDSIHIFATPGEHAEVESLIRTLDGAGGGGAAIEVIPLSRFDPRSMSTLLSKMFENESRDNRPIIQAEPQSRTLIVRGSQDQIEQVRATLAAYGESGRGLGAGTGGRIRRVVIGAGNAAHVARVAEEILSNDDRFPNPIRVVIPGQPTSDRSAPVEEDVPASKTGASVEGRKAVRSDGLDLTRVVSLVEGDTDEDESADADGLDDAVCRPAPSRPTGHSTPANARRDERARVNIEVRGDQLYLYSADQGALDEVEETIRALVRQMPDRKNWTVFYLRAADASSTASLLYQLLPDETSPLDAYALSGGAASLDSVDPLAAPSLRVIPDTRTNALFVSGTKEQIAQAENFLDLIDAAELPQLLSDRVPRVIPVQYADVNEVADTIRELYKDYLADPNARSRDERRDRDEGRSGNRDDRREEQPPSGRGPAGRPLGIRLTLAVDEQSRELIVSCSEPLYRQISELVKQRDEAALASRPAVQFIQLPGGSPQTAAVLQSLQAISPSITVTQTPAPWSQPAPPGAQPGRPSPTASPYQSSPYQSSPYPSSPYPSSPYPSSPYQSSRYPSSRYESRDPRSRSSN